MTPNPAPQRLRTDAAILERVRLLRHELHAHPELSGQEKNTATRIQAFLAPLRPDELLSGLGGHGVLATFMGDAPGPALLFRAELDALPIAETNTFAHRSSVPEVAHKCGHDGHSATLCALAASLAHKRPTRGKVHVLFQPAEETGEGAKAVLQDPQFARVQPDMAFALHNFPGHAQGTVVVRNGTITAAVIGLVLRWQGRTAHASQPEHGNNPVYAIAEVLQHSQRLMQPDPNRPGFSLVTPVHVRVGTRAYGVAAGDGELHLTLRAFSNEGLQQLLGQIVAHGESLAARDGLSLAHETLEHFAANSNDAATTDVVRRTAQACGLPLLELDAPLKGGEDFGVFTERFPCSLVLLGAGENTPALHNPDYDFPDGLLESGLRLMRQIVDDLLG